MGGQADKAWPADGEMFKGEDEGAAERQGPRKDKTRGMRGRLRALGLYLCPKHPRGHCTDMLPVLAPGPWAALRLTITEREI